MNLIGIIAFVFILGAAVIIHEFGHFIVAKLLGIRVETFSVGFGKRLWGRRWGTTDYRLSLIPLGGYVKLGGDDSNAGLEEGGGEEIPTKERFDLRPRWQKFLVGVAGPVMNILTAIAIPLVTAMTVGVPVEPAPVVSAVQQGSAAEAAGLRPGDRIVSFNGKDNPGWDRVDNDAAIMPNQPLPLVVERGGQQVPLVIKPSAGDYNGNVIGELGMTPDYGNAPVYVSHVTPNSPAAEAGLQPGDRILSLNGQPPINSAYVISFIRRHKDAPIKISFQRGQEVREVSASVRNIDGNEIIGIRTETDLPEVQLGVGEAFGYAVAKNIEFLRLTGLALGQVFSGNRSVRDTLAGPIGIAQESANAVNSLGWSGFFGMLMILSLNLGIFNLLPIPVLDGGMIFMLFVEGILGWMGLKLSMTMRERIQQVGFVFLLLLMGFVIINDVAKVASRWRGSGNPPPATQQK